jgi:hypothetical protein
MKRSILLVEPNYKNKYPPIGLMKIATYHRGRGDFVRFFKGELKDLVLDVFTEDLISRFNKIDPDMPWNTLFNTLLQLIKKNSVKSCEEVFDANPFKASLLEWIKYYNRLYKRREIPDELKWDRIYVTTLFTFYWKKTVDTIEYSKSLVKDLSQLFVGGIAASVASKELESETGIKPICGLLDKPKMLDRDNNIIVDNLPLDYSILDEIDYEYPESDAYYAYMTRGCKRKCAFCAVPTLEPEFKPYLPVNRKIKAVERIYGPRRNLLLLDNNVLASDRFEDVIADIKRAGFEKGAKFYAPNKLDIAAKNLKKGINDLAYRRLTQRLLIGLAKRVKGRDYEDYRDTMKNLDITGKYLAKKEQLLEGYELLSECYNKFTRHASKNRYVDFNQGVDARLLTDEKMKLISEIAIRPLRVAFDSMMFEKHYTKAIRFAAKYKIANLSNYLLYNYKDKPIELYQRLKINIQLCEELGVNIYSFPMKYNPINDDEGFFKHRKYLGEHWNRKFIRAIQTILNSTKGKVGRGRSFFEEAFGRNEEEYYDLLYMPEEYILYRFHFKQTGATRDWRELFHSLTHEEKKIALPVIEKADFSDLDFSFYNLKVQTLLHHYQVKKTDNLVVDNVSAF